MRPKLNSPEENADVCLRIQELQTYLQEAPKSEVLLIKARVSNLQSYQNLLYFRVYEDPNWQP